MLQHKLIFAKKDSASILFFLSPRWPNLQKFGAIFVLVFEDL